jgi:hypothetical protein
MKRGFFRPLPCQKCGKSAGRSPKLIWTPAFAGVTKYGCAKVRHSGGSRNPGFLGTLRDSQGLAILK